MGLLDWFRSKPVCPIDPDNRAWVDSRWTWLEGQFGIERIRKCSVVLPRPEFFPDPYTGTRQDVRRMLDRVCCYMDLDPGCIKLSLYDEQAGRHPMFGDKWQGTVGLYNQEGGKFRISIEAANLHDPLAPLATIAHELAHVHLLGHKRLSGKEDDHEPLTDLLTVFLGLGVLSANSVIREQSWHEGRSSVGVEHEPTRIPHHADLRVRAGSFRPGAKRGRGLVVARASSRCAVGVQAGTAVPIG